MPNVANLLKTEISRLARREVNREVAPLRQSVSRARHEIAALKRTIADLTRQLARTRKAAERAAGATQEPQETEADSNLRFRASGFAQHRKRLGLSAADMGRLLGVSGQTIYGWESGEVRPRRSQLPAIAEIRTLGKRAALQRLEEKAAARTPKSRKR